jgi:O-antigen/teichoic acid export membrane protein
MKRVGRQTLIYGAGILLSRAVAFIMLPIYTRFLTPSDYGILQLIDMTLEVLSIIAGSRIASGIYLYYHRAKEPQEKRAVVSTALILVLVTYGLVAAVTLVAAPTVSAWVFRTSAYGNLLRIAAAGFFLNALVWIPLHYIRLKERPGLYVIVSAVKLVMQLGLNIYFVVVLERAVEGVLLSTLIANAVIGCGLAVYLLKDVGVHFSRDASRKLLRYGVPLIGTQIATFVATFSDRFFIERAAGTAEVGIYGLAYQFGFLLAAVGYQPFHMVWEPVRFEIAKRDDRDQIYARSFLYFNILLLTTAVGIVLFVEDVIRVMSDPAFHRAAELVPLIVLAYVLQSWTGFHDLGILMREKTEHITLANWAGAIVSLFGYWWLVPAYLGWGAAIATVAGFAVRQIIVYSVSQRLWPIAFDWPPIWRLAAISLAVSLTAILLPTTGILLSVGLRLLLFAIYLAGVWHANIIPPEGREAVIAVVRDPRGAMSTLRGKNG